MLEKFWETVMGSKPPPVEDTDKLPAVIAQASKDLRAATHELERSVVKVQERTDKLHTLIMEMRRDEDDYNLSNGGGDPLSD